MGKTDAEIKQLMQDKERELIRKYPMNRQKHIVRDKILKYYKAIMKDSE